MINTRTNIVFILLALGTIGCAKEKKLAIEDPVLNGITQIEISRGETHSIDLEESEISWKGTKRLFTAGHEGTIKLEKGSLIFEDDKLVGGKIVADMRTIRITKTEVSENDKNFLTNYLKTTEFNIADYPRAIFEISRVVYSSADKEKVQVSGKMTIKDVTKEISFPAKIVQMDRDSKNFLAEITLKRSEWGIGRDGNLLERNLVDNNFDIKVNLLTEEQEKK